MDAKKGMTLYKTSLLIVVAAVLVQLLHSYPSLTDSYAIADDVRLSVYWMQTFEDSSLYPDDVLTDYSAYAYGQPLGFVWMYKFFMVFFHSPLLVFKLLGFLLVPLAALFVFKIGKQLKDERLGYYLVVLFLVFLPLMNIFRGYYKDMAVLFFFAFVYCLLSSDFLKSSVVMVLTVFFYPSITLICLFMMFFDLLHRVYRQKLLANKQVIVTYGVSFFVVLGLLLQMYVLTATDAYGSFVSFDEAQEMPEFYAGGKMRFSGIPVLPLSAFVNPLVGLTAKVFVPELFVYGAGFLDGKSLHLAFVFFRLLLVGAFSVFACLQFRKNGLPRIFWLLLGTSIVLSLLAKVFAFHLFYPSRYWRFTYPLLLMLFTGLVLHRMKKRSVMVFFGCVGVFFFIPMLQLGQSMMDSTSCGSQSALLDFISGLPVDTLIAGHPYDMDCVPTFSKRSAYVTFEHTLPHHVGFYGEMERRTDAVFDAYYSSDVAAVGAFCELEEVDYFVFSDSRFRDVSYFAPYSNRIQALVALNDGNFSYQKMDDFVYRDEEFAVVSC
ncbi:MAG: hypothetical protein O2779_00585 [Nanoarchaeota archaeon]|nr:hypothetical protein [Nanoarchaeota archaeon]